MSQFAREWPEDFMERWEYMLEAADQLRKERRENPLLIAEVEAREALETDVA